MTAPARLTLPSHGLKKPEIAYLPTACAETLPFPPPTVLSCCRPDMGWQSWRFEGETCESPHISVYNSGPKGTSRGTSFSALVMAGLDIPGRGLPDLGLKLCRTRASPRSVAIHVFGRLIPGSRSAKASLVRGWN